MKNKEFPNPNAVHPVIGCEKKFTLNRVFIILAICQHSLYSTATIRKDIKNLIDTWNEADSKCLTDIKCADYYNKNEKLSHKNKNSLEPQGFKRVSLGGAVVT